MKGEPAASRRIAIAVSGSGRSLVNFLERESTTYQVAAVIASRPDCRAVAIAEEHGLPLFIESFTPARLQEVGDRLYRWLAEHEVGWVALAGFLKLFPLDPRWQGRIVNIHPALLPRHGGPGMYGDRVHRAVIAAGDEESGATVHFVTARYDEGAAIAQIVVPVRAGDTEALLAARVFDAECHLYPEVMSQLIARRLPLPDGGILKITHDPLHNASHESPA